MNSFFNTEIDIDKAELLSLIENFDDLNGGAGERNIIKILKFNGININIKAFKIPNIINQVVYSFFRKSKAQRSFEYAIELKNLGIGTPKPIAYFEYKSNSLFKKSFYVSEQQDCDLTYRELTTNFDYSDYDDMLKGIHFLDHSPGNTLIKKKDKSYDFYLVDLNRMNFGPLDFETRIKNFAKLTIHKSMVEIMSDEYAKCIGKPYDKIFDLMWKETEAFQYRFHRKKRLKKRLKFWKKK